MAKFLLLAHYEHGPGRPGTPADIRAYLDYDRALDDALTASGELVDAVHVTGPAQARLVVGTAVSTVSAGRPLLARYRIVDVADEARALEIAGLMSAAPGPGGRPLEQPIEVRRVLVPEPLRES
jgi:hypothetical protein